MAVLNVTKQKYDIIYALTRINVHSFSTYYAIYVIIS